MGNSHKIKLFKNPLLRKGSIALLIASFVLSLFTVIFYISQSSMIQSLSRMNNEFVRQVDTISGSVLDIINNTAMQMFYSRSVKTMRTSTTLSNAERTIGLRDLGNIVSSTTFLSSAMIYNSNLDYVFTSEGGHVSVISELFHDKNAVELLKSRIKRDSSGPIKRQASGGECYSFLFFEPNLPDSGSLLLNVRADWYERHLLGISPDYNCVILNGEGEIMVMGSGPLNEQVQRVWPTLLSRFEQDREHGFILQSGGKTGWMYCQLRNLGWYCLRPFSTETLLPGLTKMRNCALCILMIMCALLICGTFYALLRLYLPIRAVQETLQKRGKPEGQMVQQVDELLESQMEQELALRVERLLNGKEDVGIDYPVALLLIETSNCGAVRDEAAAFFSAPALVAKNNFGCAVIADGSSEHRLFEFCGTVCDLLGTRCLYGQPRESALELAQSHRNLLELWQLRFLYSGQHVLSETSILAHSLSLNFKTKDTEPLFSALRMGQLAEARIQWKLIFDKIRYGRFSDFRFFVDYIFKHLTTLQTELGLEPIRLSPSKINKLEDIRHLHEALDKIFIRISAAQSSHRRKKLGQLAARINKRIAAGYDDDTLSAQQIAHEMGMNAAYLGRLYRESTGISIGEAIKRTRIKNAKRLLKERTSEPVKNIAVKVGFTNTKYFFVVFKDMVGMTPKEFQSGRNWEIP